MVQVKREKKRMVSDAMAKNSRQLLNAHIYNYLIENKRYETARQFLLEADVPLSEERSDEEAGYSQARQNARLEAGVDLLPASMMMDCADTFLHEWWECFNCLQKYVDSTPLEDLKEDSRHREPIVPLVPLNPNAFGNMGSRNTTASRVPGSMNANQFPQQVRAGMTTNPSPNMPFNGQYTNFESNQSMPVNAYPQDSMPFTMQQQPPQTQQYPGQFPQQLQR
ncbi:hypothetical protein HG536_0A02740 [Torulaspora globosa]|uniref:Uncharacterized protein n=1 Tax=Torulaspora globosa TaxID=48254 RepID=A0A7G3ZAC1_9SACH|nr:uncharacterized protein HG536_0A02740 [Torulaspora globosa]QLL30457.1 hypothetical protein HG536_0A02740 [Torulaspora globosa]